MLHVKHLIKGTDVQKAKKESHMYWESVLASVWTVSGRLLVLPRSEHWITRRWHWHLKGHLGPSGMMGWNLPSGTSATPDPASSSIMKSKKPDWRKGGKAQHAVTRSRETQADLMVPLAGSLEDETQFKGLGGYVFKTVRLWLVLKIPYSVRLSLIHCYRGKVERGEKIDFERGSESTAAWERQNRRRWLRSRGSKGKGQRWRAPGLNTWV